MTAIQQFAGFYTQSLGFSVVPLLPRAKAPHVSGYLQREFGPDDFREGANLGLKSIGGIVVLDDDCAKRGLQLHNAFLPRKHCAIYGRPSAPRSKRVYHCPTLTTTRTWTDLQGEHLLQLRVGQQDMAPPSIHPDGERLTWVEPLWRGMLDTIDSEALITACTLRATAAVIALSWPARGRRELRLAFARVLLETLAIRDDVATDVLRLACELGGSDANGIKHATSAVRYTRDALANHERALGAGHVRKTLPEGAALLRRLREWFGKTAALAHCACALKFSFGQRFRVVRRVLAGQHRC